MHNWFHTIAVVVQVLSALGVILLVLLQHGKGADMGAAFGSGASGSLFGATGSANFLSRSTGVLAGLFLASTLALAFLSNDRPRARESLMQGTVPASPAADIPATRPPQGPSDVPSVSPGSGAAAGLSRIERPVGAFCRWRFDRRVPGQRRIVDLRRRRGERPFATVERSIESRAQCCSIRGRERPESEVKSFRRSDRICAIATCRRGEIGRHAILRG